MKECMDNSLHRILSEPILSLGEKMDPGNGSGSSRTKWSGGSSGSFCARCDSMFAAGI